MFNPNRENLRVTAAADIPARAVFGLISRMAGEGAGLIAVRLRGYVAKSVDRCAGLPLRLRFSKAARNVQRAICLFCTSSR